MKKRQNDSSGAWALRITLSVALPLTSAVLLAFSFNLKPSTLPSFATLFTVTTTADHNDFTCDSDCTLREAIQAANNTVGDSVINFNIPTTDPGYSNGVWTINLSSALPSLNTSNGTSNLSISGPGADKLTVQNSNPGNNHAFRIFNVTTNGTASISGITIANGWIYSATDYLGAGIQNYNAGIVNVTGCILKGNYAAQYIDNLGHAGPAPLGGGIANRAGGIINVSSSTLDSNSGGYAGGGIYNSGNGTVNVSNSTISHNNGGRYGGAIYNDNITNLTNTTLDGNYAWFGGGVYNDVGTVVITGCTLNGNSSIYSGGGVPNVGVGGGIYNVNPAVVNIINSTLFNNGNDQGNTNNGGGIYNAGTLTVTNSTLALNYINGAGGGIFNDSAGTATIKSTIIAHNAFISGGSGTLVGGPDLYGSFTSQGYNLVGRTDSNTGFTASTDLTGSGVFPLDPGFELDSGNVPFLKDNGGPTQTVALICGSTAIDQGTRNGLTGTLTTDQRGSGFPRVFDDPAVTNADDGTDIGAFELQQSCGGPTCDQVLFSENFDGVTAPALPAGWTATDPDVLVQEWATSSTTPDTAPNDAFVSDPTTAADARLTSPVINISTDSAKLIFRNNYNIYYDPLGSDDDGGVLEISINGGAFTDIIDAGGSFVSGGYNANIYNPVICCNRDVWTGNSNGYVTTIVNLPTGLAGKNIQLRWRLGSVQNSLGAPGWRIDTIKLMGCVETRAQVGPTFTVTTAADDDDDTCSLSDCTLREAINAANATSGPNTITFAATVTGSITLSLGTLNVTDSTTIIGPGARVLSVNGNATYRIFYFSAGTSTISGLTISNGAVAGPSTQAVTGAGAIFNQGTLTVNDCTVSNNQALGSNYNGPGGGSGGTVEGGAIANSGMLTLNRCTLNANGVAGGRGGDNFATGTHAGNGGAGEGGAVFNYATGTLSISNCTFNGNGATGGAGGNGYFGGNGGNGGGAGVFNLGTMTVTAATVSGNTGTGGAGGTGSSGPPGMPGSGIGGLAAASGSNAVGDTISAGNTGNNGKDVNGTFSSNGYNLIGSGDHSTGFTNGTNHDQVGTDAASITAQLAALQNNGGATNTMALLSNSPAINSGNPNAPSQDQRYYLRSGVPDVGAFEYQGTLAPVSAVSQKTHGSAGAFNVTLPLTGPAGIECRSGGSTNDHRLILTFATPVTVNGAPQVHVTTGTGQVGSAGSSNGGVASVTGGVVTVPLTNVSNAQQIAVTLSSVSDGTNTNNVVIPMSVLLGDTTANGTVNSSDIAQTQSQSGQPVNSSNFREDVTVNGSINSSDIALVQSKSGTALPAAPTGTDRTTYRSVDKIDRAR